MTEEKKVFKTIQKHEIKEILLNLKKRPGFELSRRHDIDSDFIEKQSCPLCDVSLVFQTFSTETEYCEFRISGICVECQLLHFENLT